MAQQNPYSLRLDEILMAKVKVIAGEQRRSVNMEIERMVEQGLPNMKRKMAKFMFR